MSCVPHYCYGTSQYDMKCVEDDVEARFSIPLYGFRQFVKMKWPGADTLFCISLYDSTVLFVFTFLRVIKPIVCEMHGGYCSAFSPLVFCCYAGKTFIFSGRLVGLFSWH